MRIVRGTELSIALTCRGDGLTTQCSGRCTLCDISKIFLEFHVRLPLSGDDVRNGLSQYSQYRTEYGSFE